MEPMGRLLEARETPPIQIRSGCSLQAHRLQSPFIQSLNPTLYTLHAFRRAFDGLGGPNFLLERGLWCILYNINGGLQGDAVRNYSSGLDSIALVA